MVLNNLTVRAVRVVEKLAKGKIAAVLAILMIGGLAGYFFCHDYAQGTVILSIQDQPSSQNGNSQHYNPTILHIYVTLTEIDIHQIGIGTVNDAGWTPIEVGFPRWLGMVSVINSPKTLTSTNLATGTQDHVRFPLASAMVTFSTVGNVTYTIPSGILKVSIIGGGFQSSPGTRTNLLLTLSFSYSEIMAMNGHLTPHLTAQVVS